jgi:DNA-binding CsgD family transcriptional regulator
MEPMILRSDADLLPGETKWPDEGCELFPRCLKCPLPACVEDEFRGRQRLRLDERNRRMSELRRQGKSAREIAALFGVSRRTVERAVKNQKSKIKVES